MITLKKVFLVFTSIIFLSLHSYAQNFTAPDWSYDKTIYEVNIRQYTPEGTFKAFEEHLLRLKEMGVGILWLMPIHPVGELNRKGTLGSYYSVKDYKAVNPEFGSSQDFKSLVDKIHELGMFVIIDWVANHTAWDHKWITDKPDFYSKDSDGKIIPPNPDWTDVADLNFDNKELWPEMIDALKYWVEVYNIDGYRCDVAGMIPIEFWLEARKELEEIKNVFMLAEWDTPEMHTVFDMSYDWESHKIMNGIAKGENDVRDFVDHLNKNKTKFIPEAFRMQFTSNHDENSWNGTEFERLGNAAETFAALTFVIPGMPLIYSGQEAGLNKRLEFFEKDTIEWLDHSFRDLYTKLIKLKKSNQSLFNGTRGSELIEINSSHPEQVFAISRRLNEDIVLAVFNLSSDNLEFSLSDKNLSGSYKNYFTDEVVTFSENEKLKLNAWEYMIFTK